MSRLNVDRMRRYVARTTPDRLVVPADTVEDVDDLRGHADRWARRMTVKHGPRPTITAWTDPGTFTHTLEARPAVSEHTSWRAHESWERRNS